MDDTERAKLQAEREMLAAKIKEMEEAKKNEPRIVKLDEDDNLRLENILLKEKLFESERNLMRNQLYARLVKKYDVDPEKSDITVDAQTRQLIVSDKKEE